RLGDVATKKSHLPIALIVDLILVVLFTIVGHYTHSHNFDPEGLMTTAWPFVASLVLAWLLAAGWDRPLSPLAPGTGGGALVVRGPGGVGVPRPGPARAGRRHGGRWGAGRCARVFLDRGRPAHSHHPGRPAHHRLRGRRRSVPPRAQPLSPSPPAPRLRSPDG